VVAFAQEARGNGRWACGSETLQVGDKVGEAIVNITDAMIDTYAAAVGDLIRSLWRRMDQADEWLIQNSFPSTRWTRCGCRCSTGCLTYGPSRRTPFGADPCGTNVQGGWLRRGEV